MASESGVWDQDPPGSERTGSTIVKRTSNVKQVAKTTVIRDDWDEDDEDDEEEQKEDVNENAKTIPSTTKNGAPAPSLEQKTKDSNKIWEEANTRAPMPELIVARASTSQSFPPPPPAALQPTLRILKRPSPTNVGSAGTGPGTSAPFSSLQGSASGSGSSLGGTSPAPRGTLAEREAQYQEARSRIFGEKDKVGASSGQGQGSGLESMSRTGSSSGGVVVLRDPFGPTSDAGMEPVAIGPDRPAKGFGERRKGKK